MDILRLLFTFIFCSSAILAMELNVGSNPDKASVYVRDTKTGERNLLGETPFKGDVDNIFKSMGIDNNFILEVEKSGFETYNILIVKESKSDIKFVANLKEYNREKNNQKFDKVITKLFDAQRHVRSKAYDEALKLLDSIEEDAGMYSSYYEMKGGALYLKKDFNGALSNYRKAASLNETNVDALTMKQYLEKVLGVKN